MGRGAAALASDPETLLRLVASAVLLAAGVFAAREAASLAGREAARRLGRPSLVRETSRQRGLVQLLPRWLARCLRAGLRRRATLASKGGTWLCAGGSVDDGAAPLRR